MIDVEKTVLRVLRAADLDPDLLDTNDIVHACEVLEKVLQEAAQPPRVIQFHRANTSGVLMMPIDNIIAVAGDIAKADELTSRLLCVGGLEIPVVGSSREVCARVWGAVGVTYKLRQRVVELETETAALHEEIDRLHARMKQSRDDHGAEREGVSKTTTDSAHGADGGEDSQDSVESSVEEAASTEGSTTRESA